MRRLLRKARFDIDAIRDDLTGYVTECLGADDGVLILDETGFVKKGRAPVGVARQYSGTAGRIESSQIAVFAAYASSKGLALADRELYLPKDWSEDPARCAAAEVPAERIAAGTVTKPRLAQAMIERAQALGLPFRWVTADAAYGSAKYLRIWLESLDLFHVLALRGKDDVVIGQTPRRADRVIAELPESAWQRFSVGAGSHGPRRYDWARVPVRPFWRPGRGHSLIARRSISDPTHIAYYIAYGPRRSSLTDLTWTCLGSFTARIEIYERSSGLTAAGVLAVENLHDPEAIERWELLCRIDPVFRLVFEDGSDFEVRVEPGTKTGAFELVECTEEPTRKVTLELGLLT